jgi:predicted RNase H-like nuclease (RuvC/YqgF family)
MPEPDGTNLEKQSDLPEQRLRISLENAEMEIANYKERITVLKTENSRLTAEVSDLRAKLAESEKKAENFKRMYLEVAQLDQRLTSSEDTTQN